MITCPLETQSSFIEINNYSLTFTLVGCLKELLGLSCHLWGVCLCAPQLCATPEINAHAIHNLYRLCLNIYICDVLFETK